MSGIPPCRESDLVFCCCIREPIPGYRKHKGYLLVHDNTDSIVKQALTKYNGIELGVDLVLVEDRQNGDRIGS